MVKPTKAQLKALRGIWEYGQDGWTMMWPEDVSRISLARCVENTWLKKGAVGEGGLPFVAYRLTDAGRAVLDKYGGASGEDSV